MSGKSLGDRMKEYEAVTTSATLTRRVPVLVRLDGKSFHTFSRKLESPYDEVFHECMTKTAMDLCKITQGAKFAYHFSDEISLLLTDYNTIDTESYFGYSLQKVVSVTAAACTAFFANACMEHGVSWCPPFPMFDCRAFNVPCDDIVNYFLWRQQDCTRNSIQTLARTMFSHKQLMNKNTSEMQDMMMEKCVNWNKQTTRFKRGIAVSNPGVTGWVADYETPIFSKDRDYIEQWVNPPEEDEGREPIGMGENWKSAEDLGFNVKQHPRKAVEV
jgi:tRNA(His) 5'-end guanylyltransferase